MPYPSQNTEYTYQRRDLSTARKVAGLPDGYLATMAGIWYLSDSSATGSNSATNDLGVDGVRPYGVAHPEHYGAVGDGATDDSAAFLSVLTAGGNISGMNGKVYSIRSAVAVDNAPSLQMDLNGAVIQSSIASGSMFRLTYPYGDPVSVSSVDTQGSSCVVADASGFSVGQRVKIASADRCIGNRPAPGDGSNYWQAQYLTVDAIAGTTISFRETIEPDFSLSTTPILSAVNVGSAKIWGGTVRAEAGFAGQRSGSLINVRGGSSHKIDVHVSNSDATAFNFYGCDAVNVGGSIQNVGQNTDTSGGHGVAFYSCFAPAIEGLRANRCRHAFTTNDTPTQWSSVDLFQIGPSYNLSVSGCIVGSCWASGLSTHHGIRGAVISGNDVSDSAYGIGARGRGIVLSGNSIKNCDTGIFIYSESAVSSDDQTQGVSVFGNKVDGATDQYLQIQRSKPVALGDNEWVGSAERGWFLNLSEEVSFIGSNHFESCGTFASGQNFLHTIGTPVKVRGTVSVDISGMTLSGTNNAVYCTGDAHDFIADGNVIIDAPSGISQIFRHVGQSDVTLRDLLYSGKSGNPVTVSGSLRARVESRDGTYSYAYQTKTATASYAMNLLGSLHDAITVNLLTSGGSFSLASITDGEFDGQRLSIRAFDSGGSNTFTISSTISNINLRSAGSLVLNSSDAVSFSWSGSQWLEL